MGIRTRRIDIKIGTRRHAADKAARSEAKAVIDRWNEQLAASRDMLWSIRGSADRRDALARRAPPPLRDQPRD
jgi:hypothetical protein